MANIMDYLKWRGDLTFEVVEMNEIDNLILARISYLPFQDINFQEKETIADIAPRMLKLPEEKFLWKDDVAFIEVLEKTERFRNLMITDYIETIDVAEEMQFGAITIWLPNGELYISFRGTDMTFVGWKEDFNMSFMTNIPSQLEAVKYLEKIADKYPNLIRMGGHSKGGNIAVYAAMFCKEEIKPRIIEVLNADGPGFDKKVVISDQYNSMTNKIKTYIPQSSIIGRLLEHEEDYIVIESQEKGIMQHDIFSWKVEGCRLIKSNQFTRNSQIVSDIVRDWLISTTPEQRKHFINIMYEIISKTDAESVSQFMKQILRNVRPVLSNYRNINESEKKEIESMLKLLFLSTKTVLKKEFSKKKDKHEVKR